MCAFAYQQLPEPIKMGALGKEGKGEPNPHNSTIES